MCTEERKPQGTKVPHKHAALIKAWADGATIQFKNLQGGWSDTDDNRPSWNLAAEYRVKPEPIKTEAFVRWWWDKNMRVARPEYEHDEACIVLRQSAAQNWSSFGGWLSDWERHTFTVEVN